MNYRISGAAKYLGISTKTLRRWGKSGKLEAKRSIGGQRYYSLEQLKEFLNPHTTPLLKSSKPALLSLQPVYKWLLASSLWTFVFSFAGYKFNDFKIQTKPQVNGLVLAASTNSPQTYTLKINNETVFGSAVTFDKDLTAPNVVYSVNGETGVVDVSLTAGGGISLDETGLIVTNSDKGSAVSVFKTLSVSGQSDVVADGNTDTLTFVGSGVTITTDAGNDKITFTAVEPNYALSGWTDSGTTVGLTTITDSVIVDTITFGNATITNGESFLPDTDLGSDLGSTLKRFNNLWVANINSNSSQAFSGQTTFSYAPTDTTLAQASVIINPTTAAANGQLLYLGVAGYQKALIDEDGDIILGYSDATSAPASDYPLNIYGHSGTRVAYIDTSGNIVSGSLTSTDTSNTAASLSLTNNTATTIGVGVDTLGVLDLQSTSLTTGNLLNLEVNALSSGRGLNLTSTSTGLTGDLASITASGSNAANTGNVLKVGLTGALSTGTALNVTAAGASGFALRVNDDGTYTDSTPLVVDYAGNVGIGTTAPGSMLQVGVGGTGSLSVPGSSTFSEQFGAGAIAVAQGVSVGYNAIDTGSRNVVIGYTASTPSGGNSSVVIGSQASSSFESTIVFGRGAVSTAGWQFVAGSPSYPVVDGYFGSGVTSLTALGNSFVFHSTGGEGTNIAGANLTFAGGKGTGNAAGGSLIFSTSVVGSSGVTLQSLSERMRIDNLGNVGIGTTAPTSKLHVSGAVTGKALAIFDETGDQDIFVASASGIPVFTIKHGSNVGIGTTRPGSKLSVYNATPDYNGSTKPSTVLNLGAWSDSAGEGPSIDFNLRWSGSYEATDASSGWLASRIAGIYDSSVGNNGGALSFYTQSGTTDFQGANDAGLTEKMRIRPDGNVGIGTTGPVSKLHVSGKVTGKALAIFDETGDQALLTASASGVTKFTIANDGAITTSLGTGTVYSNSGVLTNVDPSDATLKHNIVSLDANTLNKVLGLRPVSYNWNSTGDGALGFIAQEVQEIFPELVGSNQDGTLGLYTTQFIPVLAKAIQEQQLQIDEITLSTASASITNESWNTWTSLVDTINIKLTEFIEQIKDKFRTKELCLGEEGNETCIKKSELDELIKLLPTPTPTGTSAPTIEPSPVPTATESATPSASPSPSPEATPAI